MVSGPIFPTSNILSLRERTGVRVKAPACPAGRFLDSRVKHGNDEKEGGTGMTA